MPQKFMATNLHQSYSKALKEKRVIVERQTEELKQLEKLHRSSKNLSILWNEKVTSKNAYKTIQLAKIILAFQKRFKNSKSYDALSDVRMNIHQIWMNSQHGSVTANSGPTVKFRGYLNHLHARRMLVLNTDTNKWSLTNDSIALIVES